ncbi:MAG: tRNA uracil 4-sulfurtransferase ThiI [Actinomycetota bacterium]|nr:tRNA 4-thiouridine(8) synthase ThiI [Actinomycetota bacterium]
MDALVAHYHEVGLKGRNREFFEETLARNLKRSLRGTGYKRIRRGFGRLAIDLQERAEVDEAALRASRVFGIANIGAGKRVEPNLEAIAQGALELMLAEPFASFSVRARRSYSSVGLSSREINVDVGQRIKDATGARVDLKDPEATAYIELFGDSAIVYRRRIRGPGGLPVGVSGRMLALLSGGIDSPVAAWRMMRRGTEVELVHFHGQPFTDPSSVRQAVELSQMLASYHLAVTLHLVPLADAQREIVLSSPSGLRVVLYRRMMMRIASVLASDRGLQALITGDSLGQVASQTIENLQAVEASVPSMQVIRPLVGMDKLEIIHDARGIGTYEISTRKHQDCCVLFEPRSPTTKARPAEVNAAEAELDLDTMVGKALAGLETRVLELPDPA